LHLLLLLLTALLLGISCLCCVPITPAIAACPAASLPALLLLLLATLLLLPLWCCRPARQCSLCCQ
jgi:hypothetical protein